MSHTDLLNRITVRPDVFGGKPIIRDMRLSVELIPHPTVRRSRRSCVGRSDRFR